MKKLIALFAVTTLASTGALAGIALSGAASVSYDDNGSAASATTYDADISAVGTNGGTTVTIGMDVDAGATITGVDMTSTIGPVTISADMFNAAETHINDGDGDYRLDQDDTGVTVSLDVPVGDVTIGLDNSGDVSIAGTFSGVTISHTVKSGADSTTVSASIAGMDLSITNASGATTWSIGTTVSGVDLTLDSENDVSAAFGLAGNTMTVTHVGDRAAIAGTGTTGGYYPATAKFSTAAAASYTTVAVSRDLTSGATLTATYKSSDESLTLKAAVTF